VVEGVGDHGCEYMTGGKVVVLGKTGRNFGAGMSGGVAYLYDGDGTFRTRLNPEMVDVDPMEPDDENWLRDVVQKHLDETGSAVAERLLGDWDTEVGRFVKIMPKDYKRVLKAAAEAAEKGLSVDEAVMAASHG
jgi:glutamate synthase (NADPH/NADH) large chain